MSAPPTAPLLSRRSLYFLFFAAIVGIGAGWLTYRGTPSLAGAAAAGVVAAGATVAWLCGLDLPALATPHGVGLCVVSVVIGVVIGALFYLGGAVISFAVISGVGVGGGALLWLQKNVP